MSMQEAFEGALPQGWSGGAPVSKHWRGTFYKLFRVTRPCATCGGIISLDVSRRALEGTAHNAGLRMTNCAECRAEQKAKPGGPGSRGGMSRPVVTRPERPNSASPDELKMANAVMTQELEGLYATVRELRSTVVELRDRLTLYELQPAMQAVAAKMPWDKLPWEG